MKAFVDTAQRYAKMRAHTATHLLHAQLVKIFPTTKQAWSLVDNDYLRFDFAAERTLTLKEIVQIENAVNQYIYNAYDVIITETSFNEAVKLWAKAFFEDKYGDKVRVVQIQWQGINTDKKETISIELCWWTHVENTKDIGAFVILWQEAVASGIKRITAVTWPKVVEHMHEVQEILDTVVEKLGIKTHTQLTDKLEKTMKEYDEMKEKIESMQTKVIAHALKDAKTKKNQIFDKILNVSYDPILKDQDFKNIVFLAKEVFTDEDVLLYTQEGNYAILTPTEDSSAKEIAKDLWLKGGWSDTLVQGRDEKILEIIK